MPLLSPQTSVVHVPLTLEQLMALLGMQTAKLHFSEMENAQLRDQINAANAKIAELSVPKKV